VPGSVLNVPAAFDSVCVCALLTQAPHRSNFLTLVPLVLARPFVRASAARQHCVYTCVL
jgi:hypothetical protein